MEITAQENSKGLDIQGQIEMAEKRFKKPSILKESKNPTNDMVKILKNWIKEEDILIELTLLVLTSAYLPIPLNLCLLAPPSEGKSYPLVEVCKVFPDEDLELINDMTPTAFAREKGILVDKDTRESVEDELNELRKAIDDVDNIEDKAAKKGKIKEYKREIAEILKNSVKLIDLAHKVFLFTEAPRPELLGKMRSILSRDVYESTYKYVDIPVKGAPQMTMTAVLRGFPVFIFATADIHEKQFSKLWQQIGSRFVVVSPNMSQKKYKAGIELIGSKHDSIMSTEEDMKTVQRNDIKSYFRSIKEHIKYINELIDAHRTIDPKSKRIAWNPMAKNLANVFPHGVGQNMRDFNDYMVLIEASAALNLYQRPYMVVDDLEIIWAVEDDIQRVNKIYQNYHVFIKEGEAPLKFFEEIIVPLIEAGKDTEEDTDGNMGFTIEDISKKVIEIRGNSPNNDNLTVQYLKPLRKLGLIGEGKSLKDKRKKIHYPTGLQISDISPEGYSRLFLSFDELKENLEAKKITPEKIKLRIPNFILHRKSLIRENSNINEDYVITSISELEKLVHAPFFSTGVNLTTPQPSKSIKKKKENLKKHSGDKSDISMIKQEHTIENDGHQEFVINPDEKIIWKGCNHYTQLNPVEKAIALHLKQTRTHTYLETIEQVAEKNRYHMQEVRSALQRLLIVQCVKRDKNE